MDWKDAARTQYKLKCMCPSVKGGELEVLDLLTAS